MLFVTVLEVRTQSKIGLWWFFLVVCLLGLSAIVLGIVRADIALCTPYVGRRRTCSTMQQVFTNCRTCACDDRVRYPRI